MKVVIIGGVAGGASAAARLRRLDEQAEIIMLEKGPHISFANCGLPYYLSRMIPTESALLLQTPESFNGRFAVDVRTMNEALSIDRTTKTVEVLNHQTGETYTESYDKLVYAPGAVAIKPSSIEGCEQPGVFVLRNVPDIMAIDSWIHEKGVKSVVIAGGGFVGIEVAENLVKCGITVTIVDAADHIIGNVDAEMAALVQQELLVHGVKVLLKRRISAIKPAEGGFSVVTDKGELAADMVLLSVGIAPNSALAMAAGLELGVKGSVVVNDKMQTSDPDIYAVGDVTEATELVSGSKKHLVLAGPANRQGRIAADQIAGLDSRYKGTQGSSIIKVFDVAVSNTGLTEAAAKEEGFDVDKLYLHAGAHASYYPGAKMLTTKIVFEKNTGKLLGAQFVGGEGADKRADVFAVALRAGLNAKDLIDLELCYTPAYNGAKDPLNMGGFAIENILDGRVKNFHWEELELLDKDSVSLLDVRTAAEYAAGSVPGFVNIPLHELRERLEVLPKDKPVYVHCFSGLRSYVACMMLKGRGFDAYNISGGWFMYQTRQKMKEFMEV